MGETTFPITADRAVGVDAQGSAPDLLRITILTCKKLLCAGLVSATDPRSCVLYSFGYAYKYQGGPPCLHAARQISVILFKMLRLALIPTAFASVALAANKCLPGQPCFPSASTLNAFNQSISGALLMPPPYGSVCYTSHWNATACAQLVQNKQSPEFRETIPAAVMYTENEFDENGRGCRVPNTVPTAPLKGDCVLGALVTYVVEATTSDQVVQSVQFAAKYNLRLVIKNVSFSAFDR